MNSGNNRGEHDLRGNTKKRWMWRIRGLTYLAIGVFFGFFSVVQNCVWLDGGMNYHVPHACECLQCLHDTETTPDGRVYCAAFPPEDIKMSGISGLKWRLNRILGGIAALCGVVFAGLAVFLGARWLIASGARRSAPEWRVLFRLAVPVAAMVSPILIRLFLWPDGFFSIG